VSVDRAAAIVGVVVVVVKAVWHRVHLFV